MMNPWKLKSTSIQASVPTAISSKATSLSENVGLKRHSWALGHIGIWFGHRAGLCSLISMRLRVAPGRIRVADVVVVELPLPEEEVFTSPPWLCVEIMSPDDTMSSMQDRLDDYLRFGVPNIWVVDPWKLNIHPSFFSSLRTSRTLMNALLLQGEIIQAATSTSSAWCEGSGTGSLASLRQRMWNSMASAAIFRASSMFGAIAKQPGRSGISLRRLWVPARIGRRISFPDTCLFHGSLAVPTGASSPGSSDRDFMRGADAGVSGAPRRRPTPNHQHRSKKRSAVPSADFTTSAPLENTRRHLTQYVF